MLFFSNISLFEIPCLIFDIQQPQINEKAVVHFLISTAPLISYISLKHNIIPEPDKAEFGCFPVSFLFGNTFGSGCHTADVFL